LHTLIDLEVTTAVGFGGLIIGVLFGGITRWANFCTLGALADIHRYGDFRRLRSWLLAIAVAMIGVHGLDWGGLIDMKQSIYLSTTFRWFGAIVGGAMFGYGAVLAGGCGGRSLIRLGGGDCRALVSALFLAIFAYMTLRGLTGAARVWLEALFDIDVAGVNAIHQGIPEITLAMASFLLDTETDAAGLRTGVVLILGGLLLAYCVFNEDFRGSAQHLVSGFVVGLLVVAGWFVTGVIGADEFEPVALVSLTYVRPVGDALQYLMTFTGATISFGVAVVGGTIIGASCVALMSGTFRLIGFRDSREFVHYMMGGALMGIGGVMAMGCTIGQAITGVATLSLGSLLASLAILAGGALAIRNLDLDTADHRF